MIPKLLGKDRILMLRYLYNTAATDTTNEIAFKTSNVSRQFSTHEFRAMRLFRVFSFPKSTPMMMEFRRLSRRSLIAHVTPKKTYFSRISYFRSKLLRNQTMSTGSIVPQFHISTLRNPKINRAFSCANFDRVSTSISLSLQVLCCWI